MIQAQYSCIFQPLKQKTLRPWEGDWGQNCMFNLYESTTIHESVTFYGVKFYWFLWENYNFSPKNGRHFGNSQNIKNRFCNFFLPHFYTFWPKIILNSSFSSLSPKKYNISSFSSFFSKMATLHINRNVGGISN